MEEKKTQKKKKKKGGIFYKIYSGNILRDERITKNAGLFALVVFYIIIYISRYAFQQELHQISDLKEEVKILKYDVLTQQSELSEKSRQSHIEKYVKESESELGIATQPPFLIE